MRLPLALSGASVLKIVQAAQITTCATPTRLDASRNIWQNYTLHTNSIYRETVIEATSNITDEAERLKAIRVAGTGNFAWLWVHQGRSIWQLH